MTAAPPAAEPLETQIRRLYADLSATDQRLADVVLARSEALLGYSATELAQLAQVSKASAARFFRRLGFADFNAFRAHVRSAATDHAPLHRMGRQRARKTSIGLRLEQHAANDAACLDRLGKTLADEALTQALELLAQARRVHVLGYRNAHTVAFYAHALLHQVRAEVGMLADAAGRESELLADLGKDDLVLAIDLRRRTRRLPVVLGAARAAGARVLLITDAQVSALDALADVVLRSPSHFAQVFDSYVAPVSLVNFLVSELVARTPAATRKRLARIEALHLSLADLEPDAGTDTKTVR